MQKTIRVGNLDFRLFLSAEEIRHQVARVARELSDDLKDENPLFLIVLNGAFMFAADLLRQLHFPCEACFVRLSSYQGTGSTGSVREVLGLSVGVAGRTVVVVEDIVDTGLTMKNLMETLRKQSPRDIRIASLLVKPLSLKENIQVPYRCFEIPDAFVVGYGLDYDELGRNLPDIYVVDDEK